MNYIRKRMGYFIGVIIVFNMILLYLIFEPYWLHMNSQIEQGGAIEVGVNTPLYYDYYYDFVLADSHREGDWQVDTYKEVKRLLDQNGQKVKDIETGNVQYMRYWLGDPAPVIHDLLEEDEE